MICQVLKEFERRRELQLPGSIIDVPEDMLLKMAGYVQPVEAPAINNIDAEEDASRIGVDSKAALVSAVDDLPGFCHNKGICYALQEAYSDVHPYGCIEAKCDYYSERRTCRWCKGDDFWLSAVRGGVSVCRRCHPPALGAELINNDIHSHQRRY